MSELSENGCMDKSVGIDFGLKYMITSSSGNKYGVGLYNYIKKMDDKITKIQAACNKRKFKLGDSKRYNESVFKLRTTIDRAVNQALNELVSKEKPSIIVAEQLDFRDGGLTRRMNRLLANCGRKAVTAKLKSLSNELGIDSIEVNPAYTSQTCSECGYVDKKNRSSRDTFKCLYCSHSECADENAAKIVESRRSWPSFWTSSSRKAVCNKAVELFLERHSRKGVLASSTEQSRTIVNNWYFRGYIDELEIACKTAEVSRNNGGGERALKSLSTLKCK